jgi:hypothetical protein
MGSEIVQRAFWDTPLYISKIPCWGMLSRRCRGQRGCDSLVESLMPNIMVGSKKLSSKRPSHCNYTVAS